MIDGDISVKSVAQDLQLIEQDKNGSEDMGLFCQFELSLEKCTSFYLEKSNKYRDDGIMLKVCLSVLCERPLLMLDFITGEKEWLTEPNSRVLSAIISPDKDKILYYSRNSNISSLEVLNID